MSKIDEVLIKYVEYFGESFPIILFPNLEEEEIIKEIEKCILENKLIKIEYLDDVQY